VCVVSLSDVWWIRCQEVELRPGWVELEDSLLEGFVMFAEWWVSFSVGFFDVGGGLEGVWTKRFVEG
jgi:hypothetical protein